MKFEFLKRENCSDLVLFFSGFACPPALFLHIAMPKNSDFCFCYDYTSSSDDFMDKFKPYDSVKIVAFSLGVAVVNSLNLGRECTFVTAINGTNLGISRTGGIHPAIFLQTIKSFDIFKFYEKMGLKFDMNLGEFASKILIHDANISAQNLGENGCDIDENCAQKLDKNTQKISKNSANFTDFLPKTCENLHQILNKKCVVELTNLFKNLTQESLQNRTWQRVIVSKNDEIFPARASESFCPSAQILHLDKNHFIFDEIKSWDELC